MTKPVVVDRKRVAAAQEKMREMIEHDPFLKQQAEYMKNHFVQVKARRNAEYAARKNRKKESEAKS